jgi:hypothetical protein
VRKGNSILLYGFLLSIFGCLPYAKEFSTLLHRYARLHSRELILDIIKEGRIVPSQITVELIRKAMETSNANKVLIDGFPRCEENRIAFERIVSQFLSLHCIDSSGFRTN